MLISDSDDGKGNNWNFKVISVFNLGFLPILMSSRQLMMAASKSLAVL
jgi:hypothetical protein